MLNHEPFLDEVVAHPDDDVPRLIYADWLEEHGDSFRAEFIRLQCKLARRPDSSSPRHPWRRREQELLAGFGTHWRQQVLPTITGGEFRRGFLETATLPTLDLLVNGEQVFRRAPLVRLHLLQADDLIRDLVRFPGLARIRALDLSGSHLGPYGAVTLAATAYLEQLTELNLARTGTDAGGVQALARSAALRHLTRLDLSHNWIGEGGAEELAASPYLHSLVELNLEAAGLGGFPDDPGTSNLVTSPNLDHLVTLNLSHNDFRSALGFTLTLSRHLRHLQHLNLSHNSHGLRGLETLHSPSLPRLAHLDLSYNHLGPSDVNALPYGREKVALTHLNLEGNSLGDQGGEYLAWMGWGRMRGIKRLILRNNGIGAAIASRLRKAYRDRVIL